MLTGFRNVMQLGDAVRLIVTKVDGWVEQFVLLLPNLFFAVLILIVGYLCARLTRKALKKGFRKLTKSLALRKLLANIGFIAVFGFAFFIALDVLNLDKAVVSLLAGLGIVGVALGFAFQDIAANFISGIIMAIRRPFELHDVIESNGYFGEVTLISLRSTRLKVPEGQEIVLPNRQVLESPIVNYSRGSRRVDLVVGVSYGEDLAHVLRVTEQALKPLRQRLRKRPLEIFYKQFNESSIDFVARFWIEEVTQAAYLKATSDAVIAVKQAFDKEGITIPWPIRTLDFNAKGGRPLDKVL